MLTILKNIMIISILITTVITRIESKRVQNWDVDVIELNKTSFKGIFQGIPVVTKYSEDKNKNNSSNNDDEDDEIKELRKLSYIKVLPNGEQKLYKIKEDNKNKLKELKINSLSNISKTNVTSDNEADGVIVDQDEFRRRLWIFDTDDRKQVLSPKHLSTPHKEAGYIFFRDGSGKNYSCTGTLVGPQHVLTAGHCVHSGGTEGDWFHSFRFCPGRIDSQNCPPYGWYDVSGYWSVHGWVSDEDYDYDYGMLILSKSPNIGWLSFGYSSSLDEGWNFYSHGYPGDKPTGTQWGVTCKPDEVNTHTIDDESCDIWKGQSGSGMYSFAYNGNRVIFGIISHMTEYWLLWWHRWNTWTRITSGKFSMICDWIDNDAIC